MTDETTARPQDEATPQSGEPPADALAALEAEKADLRDRLLRAVAEMDNLRKRTEKELADARAYAMTAFARDMLTVADNVRRALDAVPGEARETATDAFRALIEGIELTERDLLKTLERHGVKRVDPTGERFDPNLHQAMFEAPDPGLPKGTVTTVVQPGFTISGRVLRPALVGVSTGGPKAPAPLDDAGDHTPPGA